VAVFLGLVKEGKPLTIWGDGTITRDYIYIGDVVPMLIKALQARTPSRVFNLGSGEGTSLHDLTTIIEAVTSRDVTVRYSEKRSIDVPTNVLDISRVQGELGFRPKVPLREGIRKTWEWLNRIP
jgi:UDP-glucose 4-epimerase